MMAGLSNIKIAISDDAYEVFKATRVIHCQAVDCKYHTVNFDRFSEHGECILKRVYVGKGGACMQYEAKKE